MKEYTKQHIKVILLSLPAIAGGAVVPFLVSHIVNSIVEGKTEDILKYIIFFIILLLFTKVADLIFNYNFNITENVVATNERDKLTKKFLASKSNLQNSFSEETILNRLMNEIYALGKLYGIAPIMLIINIIMLIVSFTVLAFLNFRLLILACLFIPLVYLFGSLLKNKIVKASEQESLAYETLLHGVTEIIRGFTDIKLFKAEKTMANKIHELNINSLNSTKKLLFLQRLYSDILDILFSFLPLCCMLFGFWLSSIQLSTLGSAISF